MTDASGVECRERPAQRRSVRAYYQLEDLTEERSSKTALRSRNRVVRQSQGCTSGDGGGFAVLARRHQIQRTVQSSAHDAAQS